MSEEIYAEWHKEFQELKENVEQHVQYVLDVEKAVNLTTDDSEECRREYLLSLPVNAVYSLSKQAEELYKTHKEVQMLNRMLKEIEIHGKEYVLEKYLKPKGAIK